MQLQKQLLDLHTMVRASFGCVAFGRSLFNPLFFSEMQIDGIHLRFVQPCCPSTECFVSWFDSLKEDIEKQWIDKIVLVIFLDRAHPSEIVESYTLKLDYENTKVENNLFHSIGTLKRLPDLKFISLKVVYKEYSNNSVPKGFKPVNNHKFTFTSQPIKIKSQSTKEWDSINVEIETVYDMVTLEEIKTIEHSEIKSRKREEAKNIKTQKIKYSTPENYHFITEIEKYPQGSNSLKNHQNKKSNKKGTEKKGKTPKKQANSQNNLKIKDNPITHINQVVPYKTNPRADIDPLRTPPKKEAEIRCTCGINTEDLDMLLCDGCDFWLHTVCCGFFSNSDKRIPEEYFCLFCINKTEVVRWSWKEGGLIRRTLSVIYNEGMNNMQNMAYRIGTSLRYMRKIIKKIEQEGFLRRNHNKYAVIKNLETKNNIKKYFSIKLKNEQKEVLSEKNIRCQIT